MPRSKGMVIGFWIVTALFCLQMGFTAYAQLRLPQVADGVHPPRLSRLLPGGALVGEAPRRGAAARAGAGAAQGVGLRRLRHQPRLGAHRPLSRSATARRRGAGRRAPACSGGSRTSSGAACRPRRRAPDRQTRQTRGMKMKSQPKAAGEAGLQAHQRRGSPSWATGEARRWPGCAPSSGRPTPMSWKSGSGWGPRSGRTTAASARASRTSRS